LNFFQNFRLEHDSKILSLCLKNRLCHFQTVYHMQTNIYYAICHSKRIRQMRILGKKKMEGVRDGECSRLYSGKAVSCVLPCYLRSRTIKCNALEKAAHFM
jgi:hypothetical protein